MHVHPRDQSRVVRVELDAVGVPHGQLELRIAPVRPPGPVVPCPALRRIDQVRGMSRDAWSRFNHSPDIPWRDRRLAMPFKSLSEPCASSHAIIEAIP